MDTHQLKTIFERYLAGDTIRPDDPEVYAVIRKTVRITSQLNSILADDDDENRRVISEPIKKKSR